VPPHSGGVLMVESVLDHMVSATSCVRLAAPYCATLMIDTPMRVSDAKARAELDWAPTFPSY
jgi:hypothetical protein